MRPLSLAERRLTTPTVSLAALMEGNQPPLGGDTTVGLDDDVNEILCSGFPAIRPLPESREFLRWRATSTGTLLGDLFESLVTLSVRVYAQAAGAQIRHLRTHRGNHEVDLIIERRDGRIVAIEIKLKQTPGERDARHLDWLAGEIGDELLDRVIVTTGRSAYRRRDGIAIVPAALLGP